MAEYEIGSLAWPLKGRGKGGVFIIIKEEAEYVYLADGKSRLLDKPKRKKKKHVQASSHKDETLKQKLISGSHVTDEEIKYFIKCWKAEVKQNPGR